MPKFTVSTVNSTYAAISVVDTEAEPDEALAVGIRGAVDIATEEVMQGASVSAVEVTVRDSAEQTLHRIVISLSVARLIPA